MRLFDCNCAVVVLVVLVAVVAVLLKAWTCCGSLSTELSRDDGFVEAADAEPDKVAWTDDHIDDTTFVHPKAVDLIIDVSVTVQSATSTVLTAKVFVTGNNVAVQLLVSDGSSSLFSFLSSSLSFKADKVVEEIVEEVDEGEQDNEAALCCLWNKGGMFT